MGEYASKGHANLNTVLGSLGTAAFAGLDLNTILNRVGGGNNLDTAAVAAAVANNNGCNNRGNHNNGCCSEDHLVDRYENAQSTRIAELEAQNFTREAATKAFTDSVTYSERLNDKQAVILEKLANSSIVQGQQIASLEAKVDCTNEKIKREFEIVYGRIDDKIELEAERRINGDNKVMASVNLEAERRACADENLALAFDGKLAWKANIRAAIDKNDVVKFPCCCEPLTA